MDPVDLPRIGLAALLLAGVALLALLRARRRRAPFQPRAARLPPDAFPHGTPTQPRPRAPLTAFYFTSRLCAACQETPAILHEATPSLPLVPLHVHERPDLARALGIHETPTLLLADPDGRILHARVGNPTVEEWRETLRLAARLAAHAPT